MRKDFSQERVSREHSSPEHHKISLSQQRERLLTDAEKLVFMDEERRKFREAYVRAGGELRPIEDIKNAVVDPQVLHYWYHQYC